MQKVIYKKPVTGGTLTVPPSKSVAHRAMICAALSKGDTKVFNIDNSKDMQATISFMKSLGKTVIYKDRTLHISGEISADKTSVDCIESGSTLRFVIPVMAALGIETEFTGSGRLPERPIGVYTEILNGVTTKGNGLPFYIKGKLNHGVFKLRGDISSQFITGLLLALPLLDGDSEIVLTTAMESEAYVDITLAVMESFGVTATRTKNGYFVKGNQVYQNPEYTVEGDWSQAAFFLAMGAFTKEPIRLKGLNYKNSKQGDKECIDIFRRFGIDITQDDNDFVISCADKLTAIESLDVRQIPDMVPALASVMALCDGTSTITGGKRLRIKESDRLSAVSNALNALGGDITELEDGLIIKGVNSLKGAFCDGCNDHRIVMALAPLTVVCDGNIEVSDPYSINKSYPSFYEEYKNLGGELDVIDMG